LLRPVLVHSGPPLGPLPSYGVHERVRQLIWVRLIVGANSLTAIALITIREAAHGALFVRLSHSAHPDEQASIAPSPNGSERASADELRSW
jgi:hypothetical protein